nr:amidohydrolase family protein [Candidatus Bathyarchaeota archaeon]
MKDEELADIVLLNGKVVTVDATDRIAEAVAVKNGKIVRAGSKHEIEALVGEETKVIDLKGKTLLPGFIDSHTHLADAVLCLKYFVDARTPPNKSISEILQRIKERTRDKPSGQ